MYVTHLLPQWNYLTGETGGITNGSVHLKPLQTLTFEVAFCVS
jgi:hypothetical protein